MTRNAAPVGAALRGSGGHVLFRRHRLSRASRTDAVLRNGTAEAHQT